MKLVISSSELLKGIMTVAKAIPSKSALPILENFLFVLKGNTLEITASDSELTMKTSIEVENAEEEGQIAIPAKHLMDLLKELPDQPLSIKTINDTSFEFSWANGASTLPYFPAFLVARCIPLRLCGLRSREPAAQLAIVEDGAGYAFALQVIAYSVCQCGFAAGRQADHGHVELWHHVSPEKKTGPGYAPGPLYRQS